MFPQKGNCGFQEMRLKGKIWIGVCLVLLFVKEHFHGPRRGGMSSGRAIVIAMARLAMAPQAKQKTPTIACLVQAFSVMKFIEDQERCSMPSIRKRFRTHLN